MNLLDLFRRDTGQKPPESVVSESSGSVDDVLLQAILDGEEITRDKAMTLPPVSAAVDLIAGSIASMPVKLYRRKKDGGVESVENDPRVRMLNGDTGDTLDGYQMKRAMVEDYLMSKGGYCYIQRRRNDVTGLFYVRPEWVSFNKTEEPIHKFYTVLINGGEYKPFEFIKLLRNSRDGAEGIGLTDEISLALKTAYQTMLYQLALVRAGGNKKGFLKSERKLGQAEIDTLKNAWKKLYSTGTENVVVLNNGVDFKEATNTSVEMQINESRKTLMDEINKLFHISDNFDLTFKLAIYPIVKAFETALNRDLLLEREKRNWFFEFDVKEIIRASIKERYDAYKLAHDTGFITVNEIRRMENLDRIEGMDVINVGLGAVLYDVNSRQYYSPNTNSTAKVDEQNEIQTQAEGEGVIR